MTDRSLSKMNKRMFCKIASLFCVLILLLTCVSCNNAEPAATESHPAGGTGSPLPSETAAPDTEDSFTVAVYDDGEHNPLKTNSEDMKQALSMVYDSIVAMDYSHNPAGKLALGWESMDGGKTWNFVMKDGIKWHDGSVFSAKDAEATVNYIMKNGGPYRENVANIEKCSAADDSTLCVVCKNSDGLLPCKMTFPILKKTVIEKGEASKKLIGTGIYAFASESGSGNKHQIVLKAWENYYDERPVTKTVILMCFSDQSAKENGESDVLFSYDAMPGDTVLAKEMNRRTVSGNTFVYLMPNLNAKEPEKTPVIVNGTVTNRLEMNDYRYASDANIRKAINYYLDRTQIVSSVLAGNGAEAMWPYSEKTFGAPDAKPMNCSQAEGDKCMEAAGWTQDEDGMWKNGNDVLQIEIIFSCNTKKFEYYANIIKTQLEKKGISVSLLKLNDGDFAEHISKQCYGFALMEAKLCSWFDMSPLFRQGGVLNYNKYYNADYEKYIQEAEKSLDEAQIKENNTKATDILEETLPEIGLLIEGQHFLSSFEMRGIDKSGISCDSLFKNVKNWYKEKK